MQSQTSVVVVDAANRKGFSVRRVLLAIDSEHLMVVTIGTQGRFVLPPTPLAQVPTDLRLPDPGPAAGTDPELVASAVRFGAQSDPGGVLDLILLTDPARDADLLNRLTDGIEVRPRHLARERRWVLPVISVVLALAVVLGALDLWLWSRGRAAPDPVTQPSASGAPVPGPTEPSPGPTAGPSGQRVSTPAGRWSGQVQGDNQAYTMTVTITPNQDQLNAAVQYSLGCSGSWAETRRTDSSIEVTENITSGRGSCSDGVRLTLTPSGNELLVAFTGKRGEPVSASLARQ